MRNILILSFIFLSNILFAQNEEFIEHNSNELKINTNAENKINEIIKSKVINKVRDIEKSNILRQQHLFSLENYSKDLELVQDTIYINLFIDEAINTYDIGNTSEMNTLNSHIESYYEKLVSKYFNKALSVLNPSHQNKLKEIQNKWIDFKSKELDYIYELNSGGGTISYGYGSKWRTKLLLDRIIFLNDIYVGRFIGENVYKN